MTKVNANKQSRRQLESDNAGAFIGYLSVHSVKRLAFRKYRQAFILYSFRNPGPRLSNFLLSYWSTGIVSLREMKRRQPELQTLIRSQAYPLLLQERIIAKAQNARLDLIVKKLRFWIYLCKEMLMDEPEALSEQRKYHDI